MDHGIQLLLRDCARYMNEQDDGPRPINGLPPTEEARRIAYVCADLHACGRLIATCASIVNAAAHNVPNVSLRSIIGFFPPVLNWSEISNVSDTRLNFDLELLFNLNSFARRLAFTRMLTSQYLESGGKPVATETSNMLILCDAWRSISLMCNDLPPRSLFLAARRFCPQMAAHASAGSCRTPVQGAGPACWTMAASRFWTGPSAVGRGASNQTLL